MLLKLKISLELVINQLLSRVLNQVNLLRNTLVLVHNTELKALLEVNPTPT